MTPMRMAALAATGVALMVGAVLLVDRQLDAQARSAQLQRDETVLRAAQAQLESNRSAELRLRASLLAADGASIAYIADALLLAATPGQTVDSASISDLLAERREQLGLDSVGVIDLGGHWVAGTRPWSDGGDQPLHHPLFLAARDSQKLAIGLVREEQRLYLAAIQPMVRAGTIDAYLYAGSALDGGFLQSLVSLVPLDLALLATSEPAQLLAQSTEPGEVDWALPTSTSGAVGAPAGVTADAGQLLQLPLFGHADQAVLLARTSASAGGRGAVASPLLLLAALGSLGWLLALFAWWRWSLQPATLACDLLERAALGDFKLRAPGWPSGLRGRFAAAFDALMLRVGSR